MFIIMAAICVFPTINVIKDIRDQVFVYSDLFWLIGSLFGSFLVWVLYLFFSTLIFKKATLGMKINHLAFAKHHDGEVRYITLLMRMLVNVLCIVFSLGFSVILDAISMLCTAKGRNFYDILTSMKVVSADELD